MADQLIVVDAVTSDVLDAGDGRVVAAAPPAAAADLIPATLIDSTTGEELDAGGGEVILATPMEAPVG